MRDAVVVATVRTPIGKRNGGLAQIHAADLSAMVLQALVERAGIDPLLVDDVHWGNVLSVGQQSGNIGRMAVLAAGWPESIPGFTIDRQCGSSQQAISTAAATVISGQADVIVAGGVEMMSAVPMGASAVEGTGEMGGSAVTRYAEELRARFRRTLQSGSRRRADRQAFRPFSRPTRRVRDSLARTGRQSARRRTLRRRNHARDNRTR